MTDASIRVLLVEDEAGDARLLAELLADEPGRPFALTVVGTLAGACEVVEGHDVILLDLSLPDAHGDETITRMSAAAGATPIVVLTGNTDGEVATRAVSLGAEDYLIKSELTTSLLARVLRYAIERRRGLEARQRVIALEAARAESERSAARARFLAELSITLAKLPTAAEIFQAVVDAVVPQVADVCIAFGLSDAGTPVRMAAHASSLALAARGDAVPDARVLDEAAAAGALGVEVVRTLPLSARGRELGTLALGFRERAPVDDEQAALAVDIAQRLAAAVDNALLHEANQRALRAREEMLAVVSHDLRNPLSAVALVLQTTLDAAEAGDVPSPQLVRRGLRGLERMQRLLDDLLDLARIDSGTFVVNRARLDVATLLRDAVELHGPLAADKGLRLVLDAPRNLVVDGDRDRLMQVVSNLLGNALKFTPAGGHITVMGAPREGAVEVSVTDSGPGVPAEARTRIFDRFYQARRRQGGVGLGLAIAKGIVDAHGGRIAVDSATPSGARFWFHVPAS